jgi:predicted nucleic acid-binding protein
MIIVVDSTSLAFLINPGANPPIDPNTGESLKFAKERVEFMIASLAANDSLAIPTPVLAEVLVKAGDGGPEFREQISDLGKVRILPFDEKAAIETAYMTREAVAAGDKKGGSYQPWQKVKFDRQIIAIARVAGAAKIYSDDAELTKFAKKIGMDVVSTWDLPVPEIKEDLLTLLENEAQTVTQPQPEE